MEEYIFNGYCRRMDQSRMVMVEWTGECWELDCDYGCCPYETACPIAEQIRQIDK